MRWMRLLYVCGFLLTFQPFSHLGRATLAAAQLTKHLLITPGPINGVVIEQNGRRLCVYGSAHRQTRANSRKQKCDYVLLTHHRRDAVWAARGLIQQGAKAVAPAAERDLFEKPHKFWTDFTTTRFHDYAQQSTKILGEPLPVDRWVKPGDTFPWQGLDIRVVEGSGYTRGGVCYLVEIDGKRIAFTGDLIYGDGQLLDLYSFQDAIDAANIRGYHGYGSRLAMLIPTLRKLAAENPDYLVGARGPVIRDPQQAIERLIDRVQAVYRNYLSTNALHWYFKRDRMTISGRRVLGEDAPIELMPYAVHQKTPDWVWEQGTSRLLISDEGHGFLLDCGNERILEAVKRIMKQGLVNKIDGIFVTHYHDDHTDAVQAAAKQFHCPVYAVQEYADILARPSAYHMPAMTANAMENLKVMKDGQTMKWQEFEFTFHFYPGQAYYHGALLVKKKDEKPIFFIGDSYSPSGIDDYCVLNRNLVSEHNGYLLCLKKLRHLKAELKRPFWLVNEHIPYVFSFSDSELDYLETRYRERIAMLKALFPWDDPNYGIDEQWAVFHPYGAETQSGQRLNLEVRLINHSPRRRTFTVTPRSNGLKVLSKTATLTLDPRASGKVSVQVEASTAGVHLVTADVESDGMQFRDWIEALVTVK